ncbi:MAG: hypothetical protein IKH47_02290, partial [Bacteroidaceae bacterium]|nr:hypothetical protein [Bacteroidaceae bacterium]
MLAQIALYVGAYEIIVIPKSVPTSISLPKFLFEHAMKIQEYAVKIRGLAIAIHGHAFRIWEIAVSFSLRAIILSKFRQNNRGHAFAQPLPGYLHQNGMSESKPLPPEGREIGIYLITILFFGTGFCEFHCIFGAESSSDDRLYIFSDECFIINMGEESQHSCLVMPHDFHRVVQCVAMSGYTQ